ncbi:dihydrolipoamide acetyltransferase family protein [Prosthecomicrobium hirschii]|uniref:dihydrolipoamide acetyltransferase family protein n=1 Tax=Prosthecodimorpha hirschii TaxID=665126 RepID=UPI00221FED62|nr:dihydrolipoamide acetyltransferase family protein [Prosthecomicrobium hirschii]MCW1842349.1 2-oxo acid dehydrogenase subunit E2 [Prosthecomicrobium hirschii]
MAHAIAIPKLGLTMTDCTLRSWEKADGEKVTEGETLYTIETEKITSEIQADRDGYLERAAAVDTVCAVGARIGWLHDTAGAVGRGASATDTASAAPAPIAAPVPADADAGVEAGAAVPLSLRAVAADGTRLLVSPIARRLAATRGMDLSGIVGSGPGGAILRRDVETAAPPARGAAPAPAPAASRASGADPRPVPAPAPAPAAIARDAGDRVAARRPLDGMRRTIAETMMRSLSTSAQMTGFARVDMAEAMRLRAACLASEAEFGVRVTWTDIVLKAAAAALRAVPALNRAIVGDEIVEWACVDIGLAVALDDGLIVPVLRDVDTKSIAEIARERRDLVDRARTGRLRRHEIEGATFTLSNFGSYDGDFETPILQPPQSALLGIGRIADEAVVRDGLVVARPTMMLSLTFDHRLIDGAVAGRFRSKLRAFLEDPMLLAARLR